MPKDEKPRRGLGWVVVLLVLILGVEVARAIYDLGRQPTECSETVVGESIPATPDWVKIAARATTTGSSELDPGINSVSEELLAPTLLDDREEVARYIAEFPRDSYALVDVPGLGNFFLDQRTDTIKDILRKGRIWEENIVLVLTRLVRPGSTAIDAGAHIGTHTMTMAKRVGPTGRVYAFEPQKKLFRELHYNLQENDLHNVVPLRYALGATPGLIEMAAATEGNEGGTPIGSGGDRAELRTIDSFQFRNLSMIKIDVEGFEREVLQGARQTIADQRPFLVVEIEGGEDFDIAQPEVRAKIVETIQMMESLGYWVVRVAKDDYLGVPTSRQPGD